MGLLMERMLWVIWDQNYPSVRNDLQRSVVGGYRWIDASSEQTSRYRRHQAIRGSYILLTRSHTKHLFIIANFNVVSTRDSFCTLQSYLSH